MHARSVIRYANSVRMKWGVSMKIRIRRILMPVFLCLAAACLIEIPLGQTDLFGEDVILWDTLFRAVAAMPGLIYFYREDAVFRGAKEWNGKIAAALFAAGAAMSVIFRQLFTVLHVPGYGAAEQNLMTGTVWLELVVLLLAAPLLEEFFFRGVLYGRLKELFSVRISMVFSAALFGLYHGNVSQGIYGFFMGLFLAWSMERFQTVKAPFVIHMAANAAAIALGIAINS